MPTLNKVGRTLTKNSPIILTIGGVVGLGATAVYSYKAAKKVEVIVEGIEVARKDEERLAELSHLEQNVSISAEEKDELNYLMFNSKPVSRVEVVKDLAGAVALPVTLGLTSIACIGLSYHIQNNRIGSLAAALATASAERLYYDNKYKEVHGEEQYNKFMAPTERTTTTVTDSNGKKKEVEAETKADVPSIHGEWFDKSSEYTKDDHDYNMAFIRSIDDTLQLRMFRKGFLLMNEVYDALGLDRTRAGALLGWSTATGFELTPEVTNCLNTVTGEVEPQIYIKWTQPTYIYDVVEFESSRGVL